MKQLRVALLCGGQSSEHAVSLESGKNVASALDPARFEMTLIGISTKGVLHLIPSLEILQKTDVAKPIDITRVGPPVFLVPSPQGVSVIETETGKKHGVVDVAFPVLHGPFGEDGSIQGLFRFLALPYVGASVLGSAVGMDKEVAKILLASAGVPIPKFVSFRKHETAQWSFEKIKAKLGLPFFLKPANMGSSIGIHKVKTAADFPKQLADAFQYDTKVIIEEFVDSREIEISVLGNNRGGALVTSNPGEIIPTHEYYSYDAKYLDPNGASYKIPTDLGPKNDEVKEMAIRAYKALQCDGMARVDFFMRKSDGALFLNEINTLPGFTKISMYPKMMGESGVKYTDLITRLIDLAVERHEEDARLQTNLVPGS